MVNHNQNGAASSLILPLILSVILLIAAASFGIWAYKGRQDYKNNTDTKINSAVNLAIQKESQVKDQQFAEASKKPLLTYVGPQAYGSVVLNYPRTWSGYVDSSGTGQNLLDGYFNPGVVPSISNQASIFALRVQVLSQSYSQTLQSFQQNGISASAYALPKLPSVVGVEVSGNLSQQSQAANQTMVVLPLRSFTLEIWTEGNQYLSDFNQNILPNFSFSP